MNREEARALTATVRKLSTSKKHSENPRIEKKTALELEKIYDRIKKTSLKGQMHIRQSYEIVDVDTILVIDKTTHELIRQGYHVSTIQEGFTTHIDINWD